MFVFLLCNLIKRVIVKAERISGFYFEGGNLFVK